MSEIVQNAIKYVYFGRFLTYNAYFLDIDILKDLCFAISARKF